jgi:hypothetical protein
MNLPLLLRGSRRSGTILIIVAGISALLASLSLAFLARMRSDAEESLLVVREAQAHIMLVAGCNYIMEASRLGWGSISPTGTITPAEGFGWVDVRDGKKGPKLEGQMNADDDSRFPIGTAARFPMFVEQRPPFAVLPKVAPNAIDMSPSAGAALGRPYVRNKDPQPVVDPQANWLDYVRGQPVTDQSCFTASWFRVYRDGPASFIITCGAGETQGYREDELTTPQALAVFNGDLGYFRSLRLAEPVLWYRVGWSPAVASSDYQNIQNEYKPPGGADTYEQRPFNTTHESRSQGRAVNAVGTISYVQRLVNEPAHW